MRNGFIVQFIGIFFHTIENWKSASSFRLELINLFGGSIYYCYGAISFHRFVNLETKEEGGDDIDGMEIKRR